MFNNNVEYLKKKYRKSKRDIVRKRDKEIVRKRDKEIVRKRDKETRDLNL